MIHGPRRHAELIQAPRHRFSSSPSLNLFRAGGTFNLFSYGSRTLRTACTPFSDVLDLPVGTVTRNEKPTTLRLTGLLCFLPPALKSPSCPPGSRVVPPQTRLRTDTAVTVLHTGLAPSCPHFHEISYEASGYFHHCKVLMRKGRSPRTEQDTEIIRGWAKSRCTSVHLLVGSLSAKTSRRAPTEPGPPTQAEPQRKP